MNLTKCFALFLFGVASAHASSAQAMECPSARIEDAIKHPIVTSAMDTAWSNSKEGTQDEHIEGFNIYQCYDAQAVDGNIFSTQIDWGNGSATSITYPLNRQDSECRLVGNFHTHPGVGTSHPQSNDPYESDRPSPSEQKTNLPGVIRYGLGPISGEGKTFQITFGPTVSPELSWACDDVAGSSSNGTSADAGNIGGSSGDDDPSAPSELAVRAMPVSYADPHLITLDGVAYSFQAIGEFVLARSELGNFVVQARQRQSGPINSQVSVNSGFAFKVGNNEIAVAFNSSNDLQVFVNKEEQTQQGTIALPDGGQLSVATEAITVNWQDGSTAVIKVHSSFLNLSLLVADAHKGKLSGLLGNFDNDNTNDMRTNLGVDISITPQANQLHGIFAEGWRVTDETSLFVYFANENTSFFTDRLFPGRRFTVDDLSASARSSATIICNDAGITHTLLLNNCIVDVASTNNVEFAQAALQVQNDLSDSAVNIVELVVEGQLDIPETTCSVQSFVDADGLPVPDVSGGFSGTLTNPDLNRTWNTRLDIAQCGSEVNGLLSLGSDDDSSFRRRFEGSWRAGQLIVNFAFPFSFTIDVGQTACIDMAAQLSGDTNSLQGNWTSSNCLSGGIISVIRE